MESSLYHIIYSSTASFFFSEQDLVHLLTQSRFNNQRDNVTGVLLYSYGMFDQILEGPQSKVEELFSKIQRDTRHKNIVPLRKGHIHTRKYHKWTMGFYEPHTIELLPSHAFFLAQAPIAHELVHTRLKLVEAILEVHFGLN